MTDQHRPRRIVVGVSGGIAAYKACHLVRDLKEAGDDVRVVPTPGALNFVGAATFEALSGHPVSTTVFDAVDEEADELGSSVRERCLAMPDPAGTEMFEHVYAERHPVMERERGEFQAYQASFEGAH